MYFLVNSDIYQEVQVLFTLYLEKQKIQIDLQLQKMDHCLLRDKGMGRVRRTKKEQEEVLGGDKYIRYLDCRDGLITIYISNLPAVYLNMPSSLCVNYILIKLFKKNKH